MKPELGEFFWTKTAQFWLAYQIGRLAGRPDQVGAPREAIVRKYLDSILPPAIGVSKGHIIYKKIKEQQLMLDVSLEFDIILYDAYQATVFPWDEDESIKAIPFEHVYGVVEVKSILTDKEAAKVSEKKVELDVIISSAMDAFEQNPTPSSLPSIWDYSYSTSATRSPQKSSPAGLDTSPTSKPPKPFFYAFCFGESIRSEFGAHGYLCDHAGMAKGKPDGVFIFDKGYCLRRGEVFIAEAIALMHGSTVDDAESSVQFSNYQIETVINLDRSYRNDYWDSGVIEQSECLGAFLNFVSSSCEVARASNNRLQLDLGQLLGLWLKCSPVAATLGRLQPVTGLPKGSAESGSNK